MILVILIPMTNGWTILLLEDKIVCGAIEILTRTSRKLKLHQFLIQLIIRFALKIHKDDLIVHPATLLRCFKGSQLLLQSLSLSSLSSLSLLSLGLRLAFSALASLGFLDLGSLGCLSLFSLGLDLFSLELPWRRLPWRQLRTSENRQSREHEQDQPRTYRIGLGQVVSSLLLSVPDAYPERPGLHKAPCLRPSEHLSKPYRRGRQFGSCALDFRVGRLDGRPLLAKVEDTKHFRHAWERWDP